MLGTVRAYGKGQRAPLCFFSARFGERAALARKAEIRLSRKTFEVLRYLVEHPAQLVAKAALLDVVWPQVIVSDSMPGICVAELRKALGDDPTAPRFIETVIGRG